VDTSRPELFSRDTSAHRELMVQFWFPAANEGGAIPAGKYPLLIFSPAWDGQRDQNTFQVEDLARRGFIVSGLDHPFGSAATQFPDGRIVRADPDLAIDFSNDASYARFLKNAETQLSVRTGDVRFVLDQIEKPNAVDDVLRKAIDPQRVGVFGHSFGGAVAAEVCATDSRFRAGLDMDGVLFGKAREVRVRQPFLFMNDDTERPAASQIAMDNPARFLQRGFHDMDAFLVRNGGFMMTIRGAGHLSFEDGPTGLRRIISKRLQKIETGRAHQIVNAYTLAFFEKTLNGQKTIMLDGNSSAYPEVEFQSFQPPP
jgi:dienelactone hydrolase